jgi:hypothetical protein
MNAYLICPVRGKDSRAYADVVEKLESEGKTVYWPARDTDQSDITGYRICESNAAAIERADVTSYGMERAKDVYSISASPSRCASPSSLLIVLLQLRRSPFKI